MSGTEIRVLHVDDDPNFLEIASELLENENPGISVVSEESPENALKLLESGDIDCIVSDYQMAEKGGLEFLEDVRDNHPDIPFILFTGKGSEEIAGEAIRAGVSDYLQKKTTPDQYKLLANRIENLVDRYYSERRVEETRQRFMKLIKESTDAVCVVNSSAEFKYVTPSVEHVLGYSQEELIGENGVEYIHPDDREYALQKFSEIADDGAESSRAEFRFDHGEHDWIYIEARARNLLDDPVIGGIVVYARDITERKQREDKYKKERDKFNTFFEDLPEPVVEYEYEDDDAVIKSVNGAFEEVFGYPSDEVVGKYVDEVVVPPDKKEEAEKIDERVRAGEKVDIELRRQTSEGERDFLFRNISIPGEEPPDGYALYIDISTQKERQIEIERLNTKVEKLHSVTTDIQKADSKSEIYDLSIEAAVEILGIDWCVIAIEDEGYFELKSVSENAPVEEGEKHLRVDEGLAGESYQKDKSIILDNIKEDESSRPVDEDFRSSLTIPVDGRGVFQGMSAEEGLFNDDDLRLGELLMSHVAAGLERIEAERELKRQNEQLEEFASVVSHDIRNPLNVAQGRVELTSETGEIEHLEKVQAAHDRMESIIEDVLTLVREGRRIGETQELDIESVAKAAWGNVDTQDMDLETYDLGSVEGDEGSITQLFENLFSNSVRHADASIVRVGGFENGFYVEDDGVGIPDEERNDIFEQGYSTTDEGTGLGLSIVKTVTEAHEWNVSVTESSEGGARFEFEGATEPTTTETKAPE